MTMDAGRGDPPFLAIPPFPGSRLAAFAPAQTAGEPIGDEEADDLLDLLVEARVGGTYWGSQPDVGEQPYRLVRSLTSAFSDGVRTLAWVDEAPRRQGLADLVVAGACDPWHLLRGASELHCHRADKDLQILAGLARVPVAVLDEPARPPAPIDRPALRKLLSERLGSRQVLDPFSGHPARWRDIIALCALWRRLIDSNRDLAAFYGFARWKQATAAPLLWGGGSTRLFDRRLSDLPKSSNVALWRSRVSPLRLRQLADRQATLVEVEDGFIRSAGLGADCVPPQSILVDRRGVHFDARQPSDVEHLLETADLSDDLIERSEKVRAMIVASGVSKYGAGQERLERRSQRLHLLVPGQVEDDRAVLAGIDGILTNKELLRRVRDANPDAHIIYKPHPDVEAGHRRGAIPDADIAHLADEIVRKPSISSWLDLVDEVHVNSSLAGFEALLRGKAVTTHGVPFYAGWGLTRDLGPVPPRRTRRRTLPELVALCLLVYPRYVDPDTNLPCPLEVLLERLGEPARAKRPGPLVTARRLQGWLRRLPYPHGMFAR